jgi:hypothetical protein
MRNWRNCSTDTALNFKSIFREHLNLTRVFKMQKIDRNELAKSAIAGGCCKSAAKTTTVAAPAPAPVKR